MALSKSEQEELDRLELEELEAQAAAAESTPAPRSDDNASMPSFMRSMISMGGTPEGMAGLAAQPLKDKAADIMRGVASMGLEAGGAAGGQALGGATGALAPVAVPVLGGIGGAIGNALGQLLGEDKFSIGKMLAAATTGAIPGAPLAKAGMGAVLKEGLKQGAGNVVARAVQTRLDEGRLPSASEAAMAAAGGLVGHGMAKGLDKGKNALAALEASRRAEEAMFRDTLMAGRKLGLAIPPSLSRGSAEGGGLANDALNSIGGKAATAQAAIARNQPIINKAIREELGIPGGKPISPEQLDFLKQGPSKVYELAGGMSDKAKVALEGYKQLKSKAKDLFAQNRANYNAGVLADARAANEQAEEYLGMLSKELKGKKIKLPGGGSRDMVDALKEARIKIAKIEMVRDAMNPATGDIDPVVLGHAFADGAPLTGKLKDIGAFQHAFSSAMKDRANSPAAGVNQLMPTLAGIVGGATGMTQGPAAGATAALAIATAPAVVRKAILSGPYQSAFVNPSYGPSRQDMPAIVARMLSQSAGRNTPAPGSVPEYLKR